MPGEKIEVRGNEEQTYVKEAQTSIRACGEQDRDLGGGMEPKGFYFPLGGCGLIGVAQTVDGDYSWRQLFWLLPA